MHRRTYLSALISLFTANVAQLRDEQPSSLPAIIDSTYWTLVWEVAQGHTSVSRAETVCLGDDVDLGCASRKEAVQHLRLVSKGKFEPVDVIPHWWLEFRQESAIIREKYQQQRWSAKDKSSASVTGEGD